MPSTFGMNSKNVLRKIITFVFPNLLEIHTICQGERSVIDFYIDLKGLWVDTYLCNIMICLLLRYFNDMWYQTSLKHLWGDTILCSPRVDAKHIIISHVIIDQLHSTWDSCKQLVRIKLGWHGWCMFPDHVSIFWNSKNAILYFDVLNKIWLSNYLYSMYWNYLTISSRSKDNAYLNSS